MKLLLTSAGIRNPSIHAALVNLLGKPIADSSALCIPTALYGHPQGSPEGAWRFISGQGAHCPMTELGWKSVGVLELTALPSIGPARWIPWVREADVLLVDGGDALVPVSLDAPVRPCGPAAVAGENRLGGLERRQHGDDAACRRGFCRDQAAHHRQRQDAGACGLLDLPAPGSPGSDGEHPRCRARVGGRAIGGPAYAIDDQTAIQVAGGKVEVISEGQWKFFAA